MDMKTLLPYIMIAAAIGPALWIAWRRHKKLPWLRYWLLALLCLLLPFVYAMASGHGDTVSKAVWTLFFTGLSVLGGGLVPVLIPALLVGAGRFGKAMMAVDLTMEEDEDNKYPVVCTSDSSAMAAGYYDQRDYAFRTNNTDSVDDD
jgi:hypothetical protein